jgi:thiol-disulfide isomerase/thioredoxin
MKKANILIAIAAVSMLAFGFMYQPSPSVKVTGNTGTNVGDKAPELNLKDPNGKDISLAAINKNAFVLVDFWASWCPPCRRENPAVVKAYQAYSTKKFKGGASFTIYSVSLDNNPKAWAAAIEKDGLSWANHVSDLKQWESIAASIYGVESIPTNFLLDNNGVIIAKGLRGESLTNELDKWVVKN